MRNQVVAIEAVWENGTPRGGFGFVVAEENGRLWVATADHVLRGRAPDEVAADVSVRFFGRPFERVAATYRAMPPTRLDVGLVTVPAPQEYRWHRSVVDPTAADVPTGERVWFVGRSNDWYVPATPGAVNRFDRLDDELVVDGLAVRPGTSGAPLLSARGLVGMVVRDGDAEEVRATSITAIRLAFEEWRVPWQLTDAAAGWDAGSQVMRDCSNCPELRRVASGAFEIGSPVDEVGRDPDEGPVVPVSVGEFLLAETETTVGAYRAFVEATGRTGDGCAWHDGQDWRLDPMRSWQTPGFPQTEDHPVVCVDFRDVTAYVAWLSDVAGKSFRLPTEAEWEYAARAGKNSPFVTGSKLDPEAANVAGVVGGTSSVGTYPANAWGFRDMHGNVYEWVADCWTPSHEGRPLTADARVSDTDCDRRVVRGGAWASDSSRARAAYRGANAMDARNVYLGFRVARDPD
ncbi:MAG: SUMF1/EgtB/PvdO family nonheme iron enzyme [Actinomycetota bacterium]